MASSFWTTTVAAPPASKPSRCPDFVGFLAVCFEKTIELGLHPVLTTLSPDFDDTSMGGTSFEVRKVRITSFPHGLNDALFKDRKFVAVKHPRIEPDEMNEDGSLPSWLLSDIATELQILRHPPLRQHENIVDYLAIMYHDAGEIGLPTILPALVTEYAEFGSLKSYQADGYLISIEDKIDVLIDTARDFGYSLQFEDNQTVGYPKWCEAPEATKPLDQKYMAQLDIYSFGLLLHAVLKDGKYFYETVPEETRDTQVPVLKTSGLIVTTTQVNLLLYLKDEKCLVLLLCKILAYSLQHFPENRFRNMSEILNLLTLSRPITPVSNPFVDTSGLNLDQPGLLQQLQAVIELVVDKYLELIPGQAESALFPIIKEECLKRARAEAEMFSGIFQSEGSVTVQPESSLYLMKGLSALKAGLDSHPSAPSSPLKLCTSFMPDFPRINDVLQKFPPAVTNAALQTLRNISSNDIDPMKKASAQLNLAYEYIDGIGIPFDLVEASRLVLTASKLGERTAQTLFAKILVSILDSEVDTEIWHQWLENAAAGGDRHALRMLQDISMERWARASKARDSKEMETFEDSLEREHDATSPNWRQVFCKAITEDQIDDLKSHLECDSMETAWKNELIDDETALHVSSRLGRATIVTLLLENGADATRQDLQGATPLHWLISFLPEQKHPIAASFLEHGADLHAVSKSCQANGGITIARLPGGTPLHWAITEGDVAAVEAILKLGANPLFRAPPTGEDVSISPFELACRLCHPQILRILLQDEAVRKVVNEPRPMAPSNPVLIRPLFQVTYDCQRWRRLVYHGKEFESRTRETIKLLTENGATSDAVLAVHEVKMSATFSTAFHQCNSDILRSGLEFGFKEHIDSTFAGASSGGNALFLAISHRDQEMFQMLLDNGANVNIQDIYGMDPLQRAAKQTDDLSFTKALLEAGCALEPADSNIPSAFFIATHAGNFSVAKYLFNQGSDRDRVLTAGDTSKTVLCDMLFKHTRSSARRVKFLLSLPDRDSDGFIVMQSGQNKVSAFHMAVPPIGENPNDAEITRIMVSLLLSKYNEKKYINSTNGPHYDTTIGIATEVGNYKVVQALLERGADPNIQDEYGRTALDKLYWRYCYPATNQAFKTVDIADKQLISRILTDINRNTSETLSLLTSYHAKANVFSFPGWFKEDSGYRSLDWVIERLKENRTPEALKKDEELRKGNRPVWGNLPIRIPERPMQFSRVTEDAGESSDVTTSQRMEKDGEVRLPNMETQIQRGETE